MCDALYFLLQASDDSKGTMVSNYIWDMSNIVTKKLHYVWSYNYRYIIL